MSHDLINHEEMHSLSTSLMSPNTPPDEDTKLRQDSITNISEITGTKSNKSTQIDFSQYNWKYGTGRPVKPRPLSAGFTKPKTNKIFSSNPSISSPTRSPLQSSQSEVTLSPRRVATKFVAIDVKSSPSPPYSPYAASNLSMGNSPCNCCCNCNGKAKGEGLPVNEHDGPQGLSWRRLHMSRAKLKATATTSELLSGFAMVAMVELQINEGTAVPEWLFVMFAVCTTVLVSVHIFALMISTYLLPNVEAISKLQVSKLITESPHERMRGFIELAWAFSTVLGLFLFLVEVAILCWVKFWDYSFMAAMTSTIIVIPVLIIFVAFAVHFYHSLVVYKCEASVEDMEELERIKKKLDKATVGQTPV
ncbi:calcium release-activated calcium channel protein 1-like [Diachasmimorpha longicaudata]|uniref:calcium release-activated calcium channel protein 1-like n=1 Tax=Diachasmimorpha longicaudata TaxID=58733 RepID=UPI0030B9191D